MGWGGRLRQTPEVQDRAGRAGRAGQAKLKIEMRWNGGGSAKVLWLAGAVQNSAAGTVGAD